MREKLSALIKNNLYKKLASDFVLSAVALVIYNGIIQFVIYPGFDKALGADGYGDVLFYISVISVMASTFGTAANYSRMKLSVNGHDRNSDYNIFMLIAFALCIPVCVVLSVIYSIGIGVAVGLFFAMIFTVWRFYGDAEFKLSINYKGFFLYYIVASAGYLIGMLLFKKNIGNWTLPIIIGEAGAMVFIIAFGKICRPPILKKSEYFSESMKSAWVLAGANIIPAITLNADRILLKSMHGGDLATMYYIASLVGKTISFVTTPLNGVMIGYLAKFKGKFTQKAFVIVSGVLLGLGVLATVACTVGSYIYVKLIYPDYLEETKKYFIIANAGQIFYFLGNTLMVVVLRFAREKYQTVINIIYAVLFALIVPVSTYKFSVYGFAISLLAVNFVKYFIVVAVGVLRIKKSGGNVDLSLED